MKNKDKVSPLKAPPLRLPGQSVQDEMNRLFEDKVLAYIVLPVVLISTSVMLWLVYYSPTKSPPVFITFISLLVSAYCGFRLFQLKKKIEQLKMARNGERAVAQYLEGFRDGSSRVFHDVPGEGFNLDHMIINQYGVFIVETKTYSKPRGRSPKILHNQDNIKIDQFDTGDKLIIQARCQAKWLSQLLKGCTGQSYPVKTVIVFPGWFVETKGSPAGDDVWVLNPKALRTFIRGRQQKMDGKAIRVAAFHLSRYIRAFETTLS